MADVDVRALDRAHVFHSWSAQDAIDPLPIMEAQGCWFVDDTGRRWFDGSSQLVNLNLGHRHPDLVAAIREQAGRLPTVAPGFANDVRGRAAQMIAERAPGDLDRVFFTNGGADANENAIRLARGHTGRHKVLSAYRSYHGATGGAIAMTGDPRRWRNEPGADGFVHFLGPHPYRSSFHATDVAQECERALAHLEEVVMFEGPDTIACIFLETIVGTNGVLVPPDGYLAGVRDLCDRHGIMLACDEVMVGFGRVGEWFAVDHWDVVPDLVTFAKGVNSGYVPLGGVVMSPAIAASFADVSFHGGLTYSGHPLGCAVAVASMEVFERDGILDHVRTEGTWLGEQLRELAARHPSVGEVRGLGFFWALELVRDAETREPLVPFAAAGDAAAPMRAVAAACHEAGMWPFIHHNRLQLAPPLVAERDELTFMLGAVDIALDAADEATAP
ncbi:aspartate aminotransferase family protein [Nitriliruptoria bacterium AS10]|nr:aspartate aminotransferase family protein [Salsipaludibacter albus]